VSAQSDEMRPTILAFGAGRWIWPEVGGSPRYHLWSLAARGWQVVYLEPPNSFHMKAEKYWKAPDRCFHVVRPIRVVPFGVRKVTTSWLGEKWRGLTSGELTKIARGALAQLKLKPDVIWFGAPWHGKLADEWSHTSALRVAHVYDDLPKSPIYSPTQSKMLEEWEKDLMRSCHMVFCSSKPQLDRRRVQNKRAVLLENAVSDEFFLARTPNSANPNTPDRRTLEQIAKLEQLPRPRVVYGGVVDHRLDTRHLAAIASGMESGSVVLIGAKGEGFDAQFERDYEGSPRVKFFGQTPLLAYPHLYALADVLVIVHKRSPFTDAMLPEKLSEYLATGRPVVSVRLPEVVRVASESVLPGAITLVDSPEEFARAVHHAVGRNNPSLEAERIRIARRRTWSGAAAKLEAELLEGIIGLRIGTGQAVVG